MNSSPEFRARGAGPPCPRMTKEELLYCMDAVLAALARIRQVEIPGWWQRSVFVNPPLRQAQWKASRRSAPDSPAWKSPSGQAPPFRPLQVARHQHPPSGAADASQPEGSGRKPGDADPGGTGPGPCRGNGSAGTDAEAEPEPGIETGPGRRRSPPRLRPANAEDLAARILDAAGGGSRGS